MKSTILRLKSYIDSFYIDIMLKPNKTMEYIHSTLTVLCKKSKTIYFTSSMVKSIIVHYLDLDFP